MGEGQHQTADPARTFATLVGGGLALYGLTGFFYSSSFGTDEALVAEKAFGLFYVNGWQNLLHLAAGILGLALASRGARIYCAGSAVVWLVLAAGGFFGSHGGEEIPSMGGFLPAGTANDLLNLIMGGLALAALAAASSASSKRSSDSARNRRNERKTEKAAKPKPVREEKPSKKAEKRAKPKAKVKPEGRAEKRVPGRDEPAEAGSASSIGRPRSATQAKRPRGPIN
jgi:hypothetical protein